MIHEATSLGSTAFAEGCVYPEALAVLEGNNPGWVFVDDPRSPRAALVWAQGTGGFYLIGDPSSDAFRCEFDVYSSEVLEPRVRGLGMRWREISGDEGWDAVIEGALAARGLRTSRQRVYAPGPSHQARPEPNGVGNRSEVLEITRDLLEQLQVDNAGFLFRKLNQFWGSADAFLRTGVRFLCLHEGNVASLCFSGFVTGTTHVIDIETESSYRRRGFAEAVGWAFLARCAEERLRPHWDCMAENEASWRLAERLGLELSDECTLYSYRLEHEGAP